MLVWFYTDKPAAFGFDIVHVVDIALDDLWLSIGNRDINVGFLASKHDVGAGSSKIWVQD